jgi:hypothetical protein
MFGLSVSKVLFTILAIGVVLYGFNWLSRRRTDLHSELGKRKSPRVRRRQTAGASKGNNHTSVEDLIQCRVCGSYVSPGTAGGCDRQDCPYVG